jgi:putative ABC transport system ATP-binding protein
MTIQLKNITKVYSTIDMDTYALYEVSLDIKQGEFIAICGPSGSGKSTLLSVLGTLEIPDSGEYYFLNKLVTEYNLKQLSILRRSNIGFIFQNFNLMDDLTVLKNVMLPLAATSQFNFIESEALARKAIDKVGMSHRLRRYPCELSGGEQQRVAIARAIVTEPNIILADEPTGNLDSHNGEVVMNLLQKINKNGTTVCMVTHSDKNAALAHRIITIRDGNIE